MEQRDSYCPYDFDCETTAKGTGLGLDQRGKKTLLSLTLVYDNNNKE